MTATDNDHDGHNHDGQLGEIYPTVLNELKCTFGVYIYRQFFTSSLLWPSWFVAVMVCGRHGIGPKYGEDCIMWCEAFTMQSDLCYQATVETHSFIHF